MKLSTSLLMSLASAVRRSTSGSFETEFTIPPVISPVIALRDVLRVSNPLVATDIQQSSFHVEFDNFVTNGVQINQQIAAFGPGVWELNFNFSYSSNYNSTNAGFGLVLITSGVAVSLAREQICMTAGGIVSYARTLQLTLDKDSILQYVLNGNGVGQTHRASVLLEASKMS